MSENVINARSPKAGGIVGSIISVAIVFGGSASFAEGLTGVGPSSDSGLSALYGRFSDTDIAALEQATAAEGVATRVADLEVRPLGRATAGRRESPADAAPAASTDLFPYSGRVLPLLVPNPDAIADASQTPATARPGVARPVGVPYSLLRSPTPTERTVR